MTSTGVRVRWGALLVGAAAALVPFGGARAQDEEEPAEEAEEEEVPEPTTPLTRVVHVVRSEDGTPIAGTVVEAFGLPSGVAKRTTGDDGTVRFEDVQRRGVTFVARHPGRFCDWHEPGMWQWAQPEEERDPDGDGVTEFVLALARGTALEGQVVALADGKPIAGARAEAWEEDTVTCGPLELRIAPIWNVAADGEGRFRTEEHFPAGRVSSIVARIVATAPGWISETVEVPPTADGAYAPVTFRLRPAGTLRGTVLGPDEKPAPGVTVHAYPSDFGMFHTGDREKLRTDEDEHPRVLHVATDAAGRYEMPELHPGAKYFVYAERTVIEGDDEFGPETNVARSEVAAALGVDAPGKSATCDLRLRALGSLLVRVETPEGSPVADARVDLTGPPRTQPWIDEEKVEGGTLFSELDPGKCTLTVEADGWLPLVTEIEVPAGTAAERTIVLDGGAAVEGIVVDDVGAPVGNAPVWVHAVDPQDPEEVLDDSQDAKTDGDGRFSVTGLPPGPVEVSVGGEGIVQTSTRTKAPAKDLRLAVTRTARLVLTVVPPEGASLAENYRVVVTELGGRYRFLARLHEFESENLRPTIEDVRPGPLEVAVDVPGFAPSSLRVEAAPGARVPVGPFPLESGLTLRGTVTRTDGSPVVGAVVTPYENDARAVTTDATGAFLLPHLAAGPLELVVKAEGLPETIVSTRAGPESAPLALVLRPGGVVRFRVTDRDGTHVTRRGLCVYRATDTHGYGSHWHPPEVAPGSFEVRLPAGKYRWVQSRYHFEDRPVLFDVAEGGESVVELTLR